MNGANGVNGRDGTDGTTSAPDDVAIWTVTWQANGQDRFRVESADTIPTGAAVQVVAVEVNDTSSCPLLTGTLSLKGAQTVFSQGADPALLSFTRTAPSTQLAGTAPLNTNVGAPSPLVATLSCSTGGGTQSSPVPLPSLDVTYTVQWSVPDAVPTRVLH